MILSINCLSRRIILFSMLLLGCAARSGASAAPQQDPLGHERTLRIAVLPIENLTVVNAPLADLRRSLMRGLLALGEQLVTDDTLESCMARHRIRYTGGLDTGTARILRDEIQVDAVLITSLELYGTGAVPRIGLTCRLVSTEAMPEIIWMESVGLAGDETPGILGLGLISDPVKLKEKAVGILLRSLEEALTLHRMPVSANSGVRAFRPKLSFNALAATPDRTRTVAFIPFFNKSKTRYAGEVALLHFARQLAASGAVKVVEPGVVRERMLALRTVMTESFTYRDMDVIAGEMPLDIFLSGKIFEYEDGGVTPKMAFSAIAIEHDSRKTVWASNSYNKGDDAVHFFDWGKVATVSSLAEKMVKAVVTEMLGRH